MMSSSCLSAAVRGVALACFVAGAVWLATLPAATCHNGAPWGCFGPTMRSALAVPLAALATSVAGAWLLRLPWFWLVALSGCIAMYAGGLTMVTGGFTLTGAAPELYWLGFTVSALVWFPSAAVLVQPGTSRWLWLVAAFVLLAGLVAPQPVLAWLRQHHATDQFATSSVPLAIPEVPGYRPTSPLLLRGGGTRPAQLWLRLVSDRSGDTGGVLVHVIRRPAGSAVCDRVTGITREPDAPCRMLDPDRWELQVQEYDAVVIRHGDALVVLEFSRESVSAAVVEQATVRDSTPAELARLP